jgi:hypothetical protein
MASVGSSITAADYNAVQNIIAPILGTAATGYGQILTSGQVTIGNKVTQGDWNALQADITKTFYHQIGTAPSPSLTTATTLIKIKYDDLNAYSTMSTALANTSTNTTNGVSYPGAYNQIASNQYITPTSGAAIQGFPHQTIRDGTGRPWGGTTTPNAGPGYNFQTVESGIPIVSEQMSVIWNAGTGYTGAQAAQYFFNSGGQLQFTASLGAAGSTTYSTIIPPAGTKNNSWYQLLNNMGTITFDYNGIRYSGSGGTTTTNGWNYFQGQKGQPLVPIFTASLGAAGSSLYAPNQYTIWCGLNTQGNALTFQVYFEDLSTGFPVVTGNVLSVSGTSIVNLASVTNIAQGTVIFFKGTGSNGLSAGNPGTPYYVASVNVPANAITLATSYNNATATVPVIINTLVAGSITGGAMTYQAAGTEDFFRVNTNPYDIDEDVTGYLVSNVNMNYSGGSTGAQMTFTNGGNTYNYLPTISSLTTL